MNKINQKINKVIEWLKWPIGVLMVLIIVPAFQIDVMLVEKMMTAKYLWNLLVPFMATAVFFLVMPSLSGSFFAIAEHELTHMLFAVLTLHKPKGLDISQDEGGSFSFEGKGNWLIALAPYFFPTFTFILMLGVSIYHAIYGKPLSYELVLFGVFVGYHFIVTLFEIHPKQTDFVVAGPIFSICFIPGANLLIYGMLFAYILKGWGGIHDYYLMLWQRILQITGFL